MTLGELSSELRQMIDARLDAIDQVLQRSGQSWSERRNIVGEVETQIFEMLQRRSDTPSAADLAAVLAALDPPESYRPEELRQATAVQSASQFDWRKLFQQAKSYVFKVVPSMAFAVVVVVANGMLLALLIASDGVLPWLVTIAMIGWINSVVFRWFRSLSKEHQMHFFDDLRRRLGNWVTPKNKMHAV